MLRYREADRRHGPPPSAGRVDAVILTGGIAHNKSVVEYISEFCSFIAPIAVYPGENELESLVTNALVVLRGVITPKVYA